MREKQVRAVGPDRRPAAYRNQDAVREPVEQSRIVIDEDHRETKSFSMSAK